MDAMISKEQFDLLFQGEDEVVCLMKKIGSQFQYVYLNHHASQVMLSEVAGQFLEDVLQKETVDNITHYFEMAIHHQKQVQFANCPYCLSEYKKYETNVRPIFYQHEIYILAISKEVKYSREIEENFMFMRSIFNKTFLSTVLLSSDGAILDVNPKFTEEFGVTITDLKGKLFLELPFIDVSNEDEFKNYISELRKGESVSTSFSSLLVQNDKKSTFLLTLAPIMQGKNMVAVYMLLQNITEYVEQEKELRSASHSYENMKAAFHMAADISVLNTDGYIIDVNEQFLKSSRYERDEIIGQNIRYLSSRYHDNLFFNQIWDVILAGDIWRGEVCLETKFGESYWADVKFIPQKDEQGNIEQFLVVYYDISDKKTMMTELKNIERTFRAITENTNDYIVILNEDGIILYCSPSYSKSLGYSEFELTGHFYEDIVATECKSNWRFIFDDEEMAHEDKEIQIDLLLKTKDGQHIWTEGLISPVQIQEASNRVQYVMVSREMTQRKEHEQQLEFMAFHDSLTQLPNRRYLIREFPNLKKRAIINHHSIAILFIDGDDFKNVNDEHGHDTGDLFIKEFGQAVSSSLRTGDLVIRIGGDEFIAVLTGLSKEQTIRQKQITQIIDRIRRNLERGWKIENEHFHPTSSMGIAYFPDHANQLDDLLDIADHALYEAKKLGKNNCIIARDENISL